MENKQSTNAQKTKSKPRTKKSTVKSISALPSKDEVKYLKWRKRLLICGVLLAACALVVVTVYLLQILAVPVAIVIWTVIIVFLLRGIVDKLYKKGINRVLATVIAYVVMFVVIALVLLFMFSPAFGFIDQIRDIFENVPKYMALLSEQVRQLYLQYSHILQNEAVQKWINDAVNSLGNVGGDLASAGAVTLITAGSFLGSMFMSIGIALVVAFWILVELPSIGLEAGRFVKDKYKEDAQVWYLSFSHVMAGFIKGTFLQCLIIGFASGIVLWIMKVPNPGALGCIVGVVNIIPIFGPILGAIAALIAGLFVDIWAAIIAAVIISCIQGFVYTFISPKIMSDSCNIHPILILLCLTAGGALGGVVGGPVGSLVGMLLAIPFVAVFKSLFVYYYEKSTGMRIVSERGVFFKGKPYSEDKAHPMYDALALKPEEVAEIEENFDKKTSNSKNNK